MATMSRFAHCIALNLFRKRKMSKSHVHAEIIRAFADNPYIKIEGRLQAGGEWVDADINLVTKNASWLFRIKPEKAYPETQMKDAELASAYSTGMFNHSGLNLSVGGHRAIANAALRHAVENGQLVEPSVELSSSGIVPAIKTEYGLIDKREVAIAQMVSSWFMQQYPDIKMAIAKTELHRIIATVK